MGEGTPSDDQWLSAIQAHGDQTMRYYATAYLREDDEEHRNLLRTYMAITANFIALAEGDRLDDRGMLRSRDELIDAYVNRPRPTRGSPGPARFAASIPSPRGSRAPDSGPWSDDRRRSGPTRRG